MKSGSKLGQSLTLQLAQASIEHIQPRPHMGVLHLHFGRMAGFDINYQPVKIAPELQFCLHCSSCKRAPQLAALPECCCPALRLSTCVNRKFSQNRVDSRALRVLPGFPRFWLWHLHRLHCLRLRHLPSRSPGSLNSLAAAAQNPRFSKLRIQPSPSQCPAPPAADPDSRKLSVLPPKECKLRGLTA